MHYLLLTVALLLSSGARADPGQLAEHIRETVDRGQRCEQAITEHGRYLPKRLYAHCSEFDRRFFEIPKTGAIVKGYQIGFFSTVDIEAYRNNVSELNRLMSFYLDAEII